MKWLKSLILCLLFVGSVAQLSLAASGAELDQLMLEFENYMLHYDDLIKDLEEQLQQTERLFQSQNPGFGAWMGGRVELDWRDNSAGSVTFGNPRFVAEMAMRTAQLLFSTAISRLLCIRIPMEAIPLLQLASCPLMDPLGWASKQFLLQPETWICTFLL